MARPDIADYDMTVIADQVQWNDDQYMHGAEGLDVQDDLDDRVDLGTDTKTEVDRDALGTVNHVTVNFRGVHAKVYTSGNVVEPPQVPTPMDETVRDNLDGGYIFDVGGTITDSWHDDSDNNDNLDMLWLVESSKQTGEKHY